MNQSDRLSQIAQAVALVNANGSAVSPQFAGLLEELKEDSSLTKLGENGVVNASTRDIEDETNGWKPSEEVDFDQDENLVDMDSVSLSMRQVFES